MDKQKVAEAVTLLAEADNIRSLEREMREYLATWEHSPMAYTGSRACLNELMNVGVRQPEAFNLLIQHAYKKRKAAQKQRRSEYLAQLMADIRRREYKALDLEELRTGKRPRAEDRKEFLTRLRASWSKAREEHIKNSRPEDWDERNRVIAEFWSTIDGNLDASIAELRRRRDRAGG